MDSEPPTPLPGHRVSLATEDRLGAALFILMLIEAVGLGWLWVMASHKLFGDNRVSTIGALVVFVVVLGAFVMLGAVVVEPTDKRPKWLSIPLAVILLAPVAWALLGVIRWAWANPLF